MILIVGGAHQGKLARALQLTGCTGREVGSEVIDHFEEMVRHTLLQGGSMAELTASMLSKRAVVCEEVGCGVVPIDAFERRWREEVGRACQALAAHAERVERICCGIPMVLKGETT